MNVAGPHVESLVVPGDVYIPAYAPVELSKELQTVHTVLFGSAPDYDGQVYRADQYMGLLHSTEYAPYVYAQDSRITYDPNGLTVMDDGVFGILVSGSSGLSVNGTWADAGVDGRVVTTWKVLALDATHVRVTNMVSGAVIVYGPADPKILIGSTYILSFDVQPYTVGSLWYVQCRARPMPMLGEVLATVRALSQSTVEGVFGDTGKEPYKTFYNLYTQHYAFPYQMSGLLFAFIQRLEDIRTHDNS